MKILTMKNNIFYCLNTSTMPYSVRKVNGKRCFSVKNLKTGAIKSICTTRTKALNQVRLLEALENRKRVSIKKTETKKKTATKKKTIRKTKKKGISKK